MTCPACEQADLVPYGAKWVCPCCLYIQPCCDDVGWLPESAERLRAGLMALAPAPDPD